MVRRQEQLVFEGGERMLILREYLDPFTLWDGQMRRKESISG